MHDLTANAIYFEACRLQATVQARDVIFGFRHQAASIAEAGSGEISVARMI
jgi:hypothetical protein